MLSAMLPSEPSGASLGDAAERRVCGAGEVATEKGNSAKLTVLLTWETKSPILSESGFFELREQDLNLRPSGYEPDELPGCSIPRF